MKCIGDSTLITARSYPVDDDDESNRPYSYIRYIRESVLAAISSREIVVLKTLSLTHSVRLFVNPVKQSKIIAFCVAIVWLAM